MVERELLLASSHVHIGGQTALWDALFMGLSFLAREADPAFVLVFTDALDTTSWCDDQKMQEVVRRAEAVVYAVTVPPAPPLGPADPSPRLTGRTPEERRRFVEAVNRARASFVPMDLKAVVEESGGALLRADERDDLANTFVSVLREFRARYVLTYEPTGVRRDDGWHELRVQLKGREGTIRARRGYYATSTKVSR